MKRYSNDLVRDRDKFVGKVLRFLLCGADAIERHRDANLLWGKATQANLIRKTKWNAIPSAVDAGERGIIIPTYGRSMLLFILNT